MRIEDLDTDNLQGDYKFDSKKYIRRYEFTEDEEGVFIQALNIFYTLEILTTHERKIARYMLAICEEHTSAGNDE